MKTRQSMGCGVPLELVEIWNLGLRCLEPCPFWYSGGCDSEGG